MPLGWSFASSIDPNYKLGTSSIYRKAKTVAATENNLLKVFIALPIISQKMIFDVYKIHSLPIVSDSGLKSIRVSNLPNYFAIGLEAGKPALNQFMELADVIY